MLTHQFQAAWLNLNTPTLHEVAATDQTGDPWLGDPLGDGNFVAGGRSGRIQVKLTGTLPLLGNYAELGLGAGDHAARRVAGACACAGDRCRTCST